MANLREMVVTEMTAILNTSNFSGLPNEGNGLEGESHIVEMLKQSKTQKKKKDILK